MASGKIVVEELSPKISSTLIGGKMLSAAIIISAISD